MEARLDGNERARQHAGAGGAQSSSDDEDSDDDDDDDEPAAAAAAAGTAAPAATDETDETRPAPPARAPPAAPVQASTRGLAGAVSSPEVRVARLRCRGCSPLVPRTSTKRQAQLWCPGARAEACAGQVLTAPNVSVRHNMMAMMILNRPKPRARATRPATSIPWPTRSARTA